MKRHFNEREMICSCYTLSKIKEKKKCEELICLKEVINIYESAHTHTQTDLDVVVNWAGVRVFEDSGIGEAKKQKIA